MREIRVKGGVASTSATSTSTQRLFIVGLPLPRFVALAKFGTAHERTGVELDPSLVGRLGYETAEILFVGFGRLAEQVHHEMRVRLEAEQAREVECAIDLRDAHGALVDVVNVLVKALNSHLHLRCTKCAQESEVLRRDQLGRVSTTRPTTRCAACSLRTCSRSSSSSVAC